MQKFSDLSIRLKLAVLLSASAALALLISSAMVVYFSAAAQKEASLRQLRQISDIGSDNLTAALAFRDGESAKRILGSLRVDPHIMAALIHDETDRLFTDFTKSEAIGQKVAPYLEALGGVRAAGRTALFEKRQGLENIRWDYMYSIVPIVFQGDAIGTLTIVSDTRALKDTLLRYVAIQGLISLITLAGIALISIRLQRVFTAPIYQMIAAIREIAATKNYGVSVDLQQNDEFRDLSLHFNDMIARIRRRDEQLNHLASSDALTGLANRRHAMAFLDTLVSRAWRRGEPVGLVLLDVDHFKRVNDTYGHPAGDRVLKQVAQILAHAAREYDLAARIGGEEFLVLCDNCDQASMDGIAERIRARIEAAAMAGDNAEPLQVTVSLGSYSAIPESADTEILLSRVDQALYRAKAGGRNRVERWEMSE